MSIAVLGFDRGRHSTKAHLVVNGREYSHILPSLAVPEPPGADPEGDPNERLIYYGRPYLVGRRALHTSPDAIFRTTGSKTDGRAAIEFQLSFMAVLAWAAALVDIESMPLLVVTSAPDSEYDRALPGLKEILTDSCQFQNGAGRRLRVDMTGDRVMVARESIAPLWAHILDTDGSPKDAADAPLLWALGGRPGDQRLVEARCLTIGLGFRDWNVAHTLGGRRIDSRSGMRGVSEIYAALFDAISGPDVGYSLRSRADVDAILSGDSTIWSHVDAQHLETVIQNVIRIKGTALLAEAVQWAGAPTDYHAVLAAGGGSLLLQTLMQQTFPKAIFATPGDSARGLAYAGARAVKTQSHG